jgi:hypothetical protein
VANFFSSLLDRAMEREPVLQRRRPSPFEPVTQDVSDRVFFAATPVRQPATAGDSALPRRQATPDDMPPHRPGSTMRPEAPAIDAGAAPGRPGPPPGPRPPAEAAPMTASASRRTELPMAPSVPGPANEASGPGLEQAARRASVPLPDAVGELQARVPLAPAMRAADGPRRSPVRPAGPPPSAIQANLRQPAAAGVPHSVLQPAPTTAPNERPARPGSGSGTATIEPRRAARAAAQAQQVPAPSAPPVQVTIGRIEVRAVAGPGTPARSPRAAPPRLTLDDYLRSRSGGSR